MAKRASSQPFRLFRTRYKDRHGRQREAAKWYVEFKDHNETVRRLAAFTSKAATEEVARNIVRLVEYHKATGGQMDPALSRWLAGLPRRVRDKLASIGLLDPQRVAVSKPLADHLQDFEAALRAKGDTPQQVRQVTTRAKRIIDDCGFAYYSDISASRVMTYLDGLRADGMTKSGKPKRGFSAQTFNFYLQAIKQFCRWMTKDRRALESSVAHLTGLNVKTDRRHDRRALSVDELRRLLETTWNGPVRSGRNWHMTGPQRAILYRLVMETGLRAGETRSLTRVSFHLDADPPAVTVKAAYSKRKRQDVQPLRKDTAEALRPFLAPLAPAAPVFKMPRKEDVARLLIRPDLEAAGIDYVDDAGRYADFHSLRHSFITHLGRSPDVNSKTAQDLARHSTPMLTARYTHGFKGDEVAAVNALPDLSTPQQSARKATGTDDVRACDEASAVLAECLAPKERFGAADGGASRLTASNGQAAGRHEKPRQNTEKRGSSGENGEGGIRTRGASMTPHAGLANRCIQPLCHLSRQMLPILLPIKPGCGMLLLQSVTTFCRAESWANLRSISE